MLWIDEMLTETTQNLQMKQNTNCPEACHHCASDVSQNWADFVGLGSLGPQKGSLLEIQRYYEHKAPILEKQSSCNFIKTSATIMTCYYTIAHTLLDKLK